MIGNKIIERFGYSIMVLQSIEKFHSADQKNINFSIKFFFVPFVGKTTRHTHKTTENYLIYFERHKEYTANDNGICGSMVYISASREENVGET